MGYDLGLGSPNGFGQLLLAGLGYALHTPKLLQQRVLGLRPYAPDVVQFAVESVLCEGRRFEELADKAAK